MSTATQRIGHNDIELLEVGMKLKYVGKCGRESDVVDADKYLKRNEWYTISLVDIGGWHTDIYLKDIYNTSRGTKRNVSFNSVMFRTEDEHRETEALAYQLWEEAGRPDGRSEEFWAQAEKQLRIG